MVAQATLDEEWFAAVAGTEDGTSLFPLPDEELQTNTVGRAGEAALRDAFMFVQFCQKMLSDYGNGLSGDASVLDFGCSWGRIIRFWTRDISPENLFGVDVEERFLSLAKDHVRGPTYSLSNHAPPLAMPDNSLDLIYAFSVFSHLPQSLADSWIDEFARMLKPGGIACLTTRPRSHIEQAGTSLDRGAQAGSYAQIFTDRDSALEAYDAGNFVYYPSGGGGSLTPDKYGEAIIPANYALNNWSSLELIGLFENYSAAYLQPCFVLRKK